MINVKIPTGYNQVMPYMIVIDAEGLLNFMKEVFDATEISKHMDDNDRIMHAEVAIGDSVIMFANGTELYPPQNAGLFIYVANADETYNKALSKGAVSVNEPTDQPYGRTSGITDPYGNTWWVTSVI